MQNVMQPINFVSIQCFQPSFQSVNIQFCIQHNVEQSHAVSLCNNACQSLKIYNYLQNIRLTQYMSTQSYLPHPMPPAASVATSARINVRSCPTGELEGDPATVILDSDWWLGWYSGSENLS